MLGNASLEIKRRALDRQPHGGDGQPLCFPISIERSGDKLLAPPKAGRSFPAPYPSPRAISGLEIPCCRPLGDIQLQLRELSPPSQSNHRSASARRDRSAGPAKLPAIPGGRVHTDGRAV